MFIILTLRLGARLFLSCYLIEDINECSRNNSPSTAGVKNSQSKFSKLILTPAILRELVNVDLKKSWDSVLKLAPSMVTKRVVEEARSVRWVALISVMTARPVCMRPPPEREYTKDNSTFNCCHVLSSGGGLCGESDSFVLVSLVVWSFVAVSIWHSTRVVT